MPSGSGAPSRGRASGGHVEELRRHALHAGQVIGERGSLPIGVNSDSRAGSGELLLSLLLFCMLASWDVDASAVTMNIQCCYVNALHLLTRIATEDHSRVQEKCPLVQGGPPHFL